MADKAFVSALSTKSDWRDAVAEAGEKVRAGLSGACDLALLFATDLYPGLEPILLPSVLQDALPHGMLLGCNSSGVIGGAREIELEPAITVLGMRLPGVELHPFSLSPGELGRLESGQALVEKLDLFPSEKPKFLGLADPMSCDIESVLKLFNEGYPGAPFVGGLASGPALGRPSWLVLGDESLSDGVACLALTGEVEFEIAVAQGCRPIGGPFIVTKADGHVLQELGGRPPLAVLEDVVAGLSAEDRLLARVSLFAGLLMDESHPHYKKGEFLVRNLIGYDAESGALMIGTSLRVGQTLQFQLRDARTSEEDLRSMLAQLDKDGRSPRGALLFSCCGRGRGLYGKPDHDAGMIQSLRGPLPLAGFFANGEIGPVGGRNFVHGYTSSLAVIK